MGGGLVGGVGGGGVGVKMPHLPKVVDKSQFRLMNNLSITFISVSTDGS